MSATSRSSWRAWVSPFLIVGILGARATPADPIPGAPESANVRIVLCGDSTVTDGGGWASGFRQAWAGNVEVVNTARSGSSSESFRAIGAWAKALDAKGDYLLIQFGHNDVIGKGPGRETDPATTFRANLARFVDEARAAGAQPVLVTSITHRNFDETGRLRADPVEDYAKATRAVAGEKNVPCLDLFQLTRDLAEKQGAERSARLGRMLPDKEGMLRLDTTHLGFDGGMIVGRIAAEELARIVPALRPELRPQEPPPSVAGATVWQRRAETKRALTADVTWFFHEPLAFLLRRGGGNGDDVVESYERQHDPENIRRLAAAGVPQAGLMHFYKGMGLKAEAAEIEKTRRAVEVAHQYGMKVSLYFAGTMFVETLYNEIPEARGWEQRDALGLPVPYTQQQSFRHYPCPNEPAYREYLRRVLEVAVREVRADQIMFDNVMLQPEPHSCRCARCVQAFHRFLKARYPDAPAAARRFGIADTDFLQPPEWDDPAAPDVVRAIDDPVMQEWVRFRCESLARHASELYDTVKRLNPRVAAGFNIKGLYSANRIWTNAVYHPLFKGHCDMLSFDTGGYNSRLDSASGALVSQIRSYKMTQRLGINVDEVLQDELHAAVHMVYNRTKPIEGVGVVGGPFSFGAHNVFTPALEFFRDYNDRYFTNVENVADIAVLRTWASMAYSVSANYVPLTLMEQSLLQHHVLFDVLHEEEIDRVGRYPGIVMAGQDSVSNEQIKRLLSYVRAGGVLFLADDTGRYNERRELRRTNPLFPARAEGRGSIVLLPRIVPADAAAKVAGGDGEIESNGGMEARVRRFAPQQWVLPRNHAALVGAVSEGLGRPSSLATDAPLTTIVEIVNRSESAEIIAHAINFDRKHATPAFQVAVRNSMSGAVKSVSMFSPDADKPTALAFTESDGIVSFTMPSTRLYAMAVIATDKRPHAAVAKSGVR